MQTHMVELLASPKQRAFGDAKRDTLPRYCRECDVRFACHGECPKNRFTLTPDGEPGLNYLCPGYLAFFHHVDGPMTIRSVLLSTAVVCLFPLLAEAGPFGKKSSQPDSCPWWRPCGPGETYGGEALRPEACALLPSLVRTSAGVVVLPHSRGG